MLSCFLSPKRLVSPGASMPINNNPIKSLMTHFVSMEAGKLNSSNYPTGINYYLLSILMVPCKSATTMTYFDCGTMRLGMGAKLAAVIMLALDCILLTLSLVLPLVLLLDCPPELPPILMAVVPLPLLLLLVPIPLLVDIWFVSVGVVVVKRIHSQA